MQKYKKAIEKREQGIFSQKSKTNPILKQKLAASPSEKKIQLPTKQPFNIFFKKRSMLCN